jgi:hypothetical protein
MRTTALITFTILTAGCAEVPLEPYTQMTDAGPDQPKLNPQEDRRTGGDTDPDCSYDYRRQPGGFSAEVEWSLQIGPEDPYPADDQVMMTPMVARLDGDAVPDVVFTTFITAGVSGAADDMQRGVIRAASGDGSGLLFSVGPEELAGHPDVPEHHVGFQPAGHLALGDIDADGRIEIVAGAWFGGLVALEHDGRIKWVTTASDDVGRIPHALKFWWGGPSIADLDADGTPEVVVGAAVFDHRGELEWNGGSRDEGLRVGEGINWPGGQPHRDWYTGPLSVTADLDGRPGQEVVTGIGAYNAAGHLLWEVDESLPDGFPAVADFDGDGGPEVVVSAAGSLRVHDGLTGDLVWGPVALRGRGGPPTVADLDGDGRPDVGIAAASRYAALGVDLSRPGTSYSEAVIWQQSTRDASSNMTGSSVFDFEGDGRAEVVYNDEHYLRIFDGRTGSTLFEHPNPTFTGLEYPIIVDVEGDGAAEIVVSSNDFECGDVLDECGGQGPGLRVFGHATDNWVATRPLWNQHAYRVGNIGDDGSVPTSEPDSWRTHNTYRLNRLAGVGRRAAPDLVIESATWEMISGPECRAEVVLWVANIGAVRVGPGIDVTLYASSGGERRTVATARTQGALAPGESERVVVQFRGPSEGGTWQVRAAVDQPTETQGGSENECREDNNEVPVIPTLSCE